MTATLSLIFHNRTFIIYIKHFKFLLIILSDLNNLPEILQARMSVLGCLDAVLHSISRHKWLKIFSN